jgi:hypothetical protein
MLKRVAVLGVAGVFLAVPPAIAKSSSNVKKATAAKPTVTGFAPHQLGQCPDEAQSADL